MGARLAWSLALVTAASAVGDTVVTAAYRSMLSEEVVAVHGWPMAPAATVGATVMGALIVSRYRRHPVGWLLCVIGVISAISLQAETYSIWVLDASGPGPDSVGHVAGWVSVLFGGQLALALFAVVFLSAPDGHLLSPRWRYAAMAAGLGIASYTTGLLTMSPLEFVVTDDRSDDHLATVLWSVSILLIASSLVAAVVSMLRRLARARGDERQQLRLITLAAALIAAGLVWLIVAQVINGGEQNWLAAMPLFVAYDLLPICIAVAVLRFRLYDIDVIINRAVLLAVGTGFAAVGYVVLVVGVGAAVGSGVGSVWPSLTAMVIVALAFQPLRRGVVRLADRIAYGSRAAPYDALADFSRRLGDSPALESLLPMVAEATASAVLAERVTVRLTVPDGADRLARWPAGHAPAAPATAEISVVDRGERLGSISVVMPPGRSLRSRDHALLTDLADQAALAFRNNRLAVQLAGRVATLDRQTTKLADSRARIIAARDEERDQLEQTIQVGIAPYLALTLERLPRLADDASAPDAQRDLAAVLSDSITALENLREITGGIMPRQLARSGLAAAVSAHLGQAGHEGALNLGDSFDGTRFERSIESTLYFCLVEALRGLNAPIEVLLAASRGVLTLTIDGSAAAVPATNTPRDRLESLGGSAYWSRDDDRVRLAISVPAEPVSLVD